MGREIRRVPADWQHPKDERGRYKPLYDQSYEDACAEWWRDAVAFHAPENAAKREKYDCQWYWDWGGPPPDQDSYHKAFTSEATHYQVYETVSEGTPKSPVFETLDEVAAWLVAQGYSKEASQAFCKSGWAPSFVMGPSIGIVRDIESCGIGAAE